MLLSAQLRNAVFKHPIAASLLGLELSVCLLCNTKQRARNVVLSTVKESKMLPSFLNRTIQCA